MLRLIDSFRLAGFVSFNSVGGGGTCTAACCEA
jgi:hypothetical protein